MIRTALLHIGLALTLAVCLSPGLVLAQAPRVASPSDTREANLRAYVELLRSDVRSQRVAIITELMGFTEAEDAAQSAAHDFVIVGDDGSGHGVGAARASLNSA